MVVASYPSSLGPRCPLTLNTEWAEACAPSTLTTADTPLRLEVKKILSLSAPAGTKVELVASTVTLTIMRLGMGALAAASKTSDGSQISLGAFNAAIEKWVDFSPMAGGEPIQLEFMLLSKVAMTVLLAPIPALFEVTQEVVDALQQRLGIALVRVGHMICEESRRQAVSYTASLANLIVLRLTIHQPRPLHFPECHVVLEMTPALQVRNWCL